MYQKNKKLKNKQKRTRHARTKKLCKRREKKIGVQGKKFNMAEARHQSQITNKSEKRKCVIAITGNYALHVGHWIIQPNVT